MSEENRERAWGDDERTWRRITVEAYLTDSEYMDLNTTISESHVTAHITDYEELDDRECTWCGERESVRMGLCVPCLWNPRRQVQSLKERGLFG